MDVFLAKLLVQALRKRAKRKLGRRERRGGRVAAQRRGSAGEEERAALAAGARAAAPRVLVVVVDDADGLPAERGDRLVGKRKGRLDVRVQHAVELVLGDVQERLPDREAGVEERDADVGVWPACARAAERGLDFFVVVFGYRERRRLFFFGGDEGMDSLGGGVNSGRGVFYARRCLLLT